VNALRKVDVRLPEKKRQRQWGEEGRTDMPRPVHVNTESLPRERDFFISNLLARNHFIIVMIRWIGLAPWKFEFPFAGSLTSTFLEPAHTVEHDPFIKRQLASRN